MSQLDSCLSNISLFGRPLDGALGLAIAALFAVIIERLISSYRRRKLEDYNRLRILEQALLDQRADLETILSRGSVTPGMRSFILRLSQTVRSRETSLKFAAWMDRGEPKPKFLPCEKRLIVDWQEIRKRDRYAADLILAYVNRASLIMLLLWNETLRSLGWLGLDMTSEGPEAQLHRAALMGTASALVAERSQSTKEPAVA